MNQAVMAQFRHKRALPQKGFLQRAAGRAAERDGTGIPEIVQAALEAPGSPLEPAMRSVMGTRYGYDFSRVRVHTDPQAARSARAVDAAAYAAGQDIVFGEGQFDPLSQPGRRLLAHELAHVVQQDAGGGREAGEPGFTGRTSVEDRAGAEARARQSAVRVTSGESFQPGMAGRAAPGLYAQGTNEPEEPHRLVNLPPLRLNLGWDQVLAPGAVQLPPPTLQFPGFLSRPSFGVPSLRPPGAPPQTTPPLLQPGGLTPPLPRLQPPALTPGGGPNPAFQFPTSQPASSAGGGAAAPSRLTALSSGRFSLGLRLGFPEAEDIPGAPPSAAQAALQRAEVIHQMLTGDVPQGWAAVDKGLLARAIWGIFSTYVAPDVARNIASSLSGPVGPSGARYGVDLVLLGDFSGGGISFTITH